MKNGLSTVLVANLDTVGISIRKGQQIASFDIYDENVSMSGNANVINNILRLGDTTETVALGRNLTELQCQQLSRLLNRHVAAFTVKGQLGIAEGTHHDIELIPDAKPVVEPMRRRPQLHVEETERQIEQLLQEGIVEPSSSPWAAAYVLVRKKTGDWRLCVDFRGLNAVTKKDSYPLPHVEACLEAVAGNKFYTLLDFAQGYWQIPLSERAKERTAFRTERGHWQFTRMPFGLCNAPASFQRLMNALFTGLQGINLQIFIDDVCLATKTWEQHLALIDQVLSIVEKNNLKLKGAKCVFGAEEIDFLGHSISSEGIRQSPKKMKALVELDRPCDLKGLRRVIGLFSYYRRFVPRFATISEPLSRLTRKTEPFEWGVEQEKAFTTILYELKKNATLANLNETDPIVLKTDASRVGVAGILLQQQQNEWRLVSCCSRRLSPAENNYSVTELEGLAIIYSVNKLRHFLLGRHFTILTDHCALCVLNKKQPNNPKLRRWALILSEFNFKVVYTKGSLHQDVDCLSRSPVDDHDQYEHQICSIMVPIDPTEWVRLYDDEQSKELLRKAEANQLPVTSRGGIIYYDEKLFVPPPMRLRILRESHDSATANHDGVGATCSRLSQLWWPKMKEDVMRYVAACEICQKRKPDKQKQAGTMQRHMAEYPLAKVAVDYVGPITPSTKQKRFVCVAIDVYSRYVVLKAMKSQEGSVFAKYLASFCGNYGAPGTLLTDNSKTFDNKEVREIERIFNIGHVFAAGRYSRGNSPAERAIQSVEDKLSTLLKNETCRLDWEAALPIVALSINTKVCRSTNTTPFELMFNRAHKPIQPSLRVECTERELDAEIVQQSIEQMHDRAKKTAREAHERAKKHFEKSRRAITYEVGQKVLVKTSDRSAKLADRFEGPFDIVSREKDIYTLRGSNSNQPRYRHVSQLKVFTEPIHSIGIQRSIMAVTRKITAAIVLSLAIVTPSLEWNQMDEIFWVKSTDQFVSLGTEMNVQEVHYVSPCSIITKFHQVMLNQPQWVKSKLGHARAITKRNVQTNYVNTQLSGVDLAVQRCNYYFEREFGDAVGKFYSPQGIHQTKRQVLAAMGGYVLSNLVSAVEERYLGHQDTSDKFNTIARKLNNLNDQFNINQMINDIQAAKIKDLNAWVNRISASVNDLITHEPELSVVTSYLIHKIVQKAEQLTRLQVSIEQNRPDLITLGEILHTSHFGNLHPAGVQIGSIVASSSTQLRIVLHGHVKAQGVDVYKVFSFSHVSREKEKFFRNEYVGKVMVIQNHTAECTKGIEPTTNMYVDANCDAQGFSDPRLRTWRQTHINSITEVPTQYFDNYPRTFIYCNGRNITLDAGHGKTLRCPNFVFWLTQNISFATSDGVLQHKAVNKKLFEDKLAETKLDVAELHFDAPFNNQEQAWHQYDVLANQTATLRRNAIAMDFGQIQITWWHTTSILIGSAILGCVLAIFWRCYKGLTKLTRPAKWPRQSSNPTIYAQALRRLRSSVNGEGNVMSL